jgi:hypothetical protein
VGLVDKPMPVLLMLLHTTNLALTSNLTLALKPASQPNVTRSC